MSDENRSFRAAWDGFGRELLDGVRGVASEQTDAAFINGFKEAASLCLRLVADTIDALLAKITSGGLLSPEEQQVLARLTTLKTDMESELLRYGAEHGG